MFPELQNEVQHEVVPYDVPEVTEVAIIGGGAAGLFLACSLGLAGIACVVLEKRPEAFLHSRSIGIHPPGLRALDTVGIGAEVLKQAVKIKRGIAFDEQRLLGSLSFEHCPEPYPFVLALEQYRTEALLELRLLELAKSLPVHFVRGAECVDILHGTRGVRTTYVKDNQEHFINALFLVGCDGKESKVRNLMGIRFQGKSYKDTYVMADFADSTDFGDDAVLYMDIDGIVESFPLPDQKRRWVVKTPKFMPAPEVSTIVDLIKERTEHEVDSSSASVSSSFGVQKFVAERFVQGNVILIGDAAHVISPIGGQGMNLAWLDGLALTKLLTEAVPMAGFDRNESAKEQLFINFERDRKRATRNAIRRAEFNMTMGRRAPFEIIQDIRSAFVRRVAGGEKSSWVEKRLARAFTMQSFF